MKVVVIGTFPAATKERIVGSFPADWTVFAGTAAEAEGQLRDADVVIPEHIRVDDAEGGGTAIRMYIPEGKAHFAYEAAEEEVILADEQAVPKPAPPSVVEGERKRLLVIDDNPDVRRYVCSLLAADYVTDEAGNGEEALRRVEESLPDLIVCDIMMPVMDGLECCRRLKGDPRTASVPVLMLTAKAEDADAIRALGIGADDYMMKPFNPEMLKMRVTSLMRQRERLERLYAGTLMLKHEEEPAGEPEDYFLRQVMQVIEANLADEQFNVKMLADALHIDHYVDAGPVLAAPSTTAIYAAAGLVFAAAALLVYRVRHVESAGDVVAVKVVRPVFRYGFALCAGLTGGVWTSSLLMQDSTTALTFWVVFWGVVGCFAAEMLLKKSFRVLKAWKGSVALGAVMLLLCLSVSLDWYGYEDRVPASDQVESIEIYGLSSAPYDGADSSITLTTPENIQRVIQFHQMAVQMEDQQYDGQNTDGYLYVHLTYTLADGRVMERVYNNLPLREDDLGTEGTFANLANQLLSDRELVAEMYDFETVEQGRLVEAYLDSVWNTRTQGYETVYIDGSTQALYDAVKQDFAEGTIGIRYLLDNSQARLDNTCVTDLHFTVEVPQTASTPGTWDRAASEMVSYDWYITLTPNASHTLALLRELGTLDETHIAPTYGEYLSDTETIYDGYRNPDGSIPEDILYDAPNTRTVS